jgi:class 3 adenylate cyclase
MKNFPRPRLQLPIGGVLAFGFGSLILLAVAAVLYLGAASNRDNIRELLGFATEHSIDSLIQHLEDQLDPVLDQARWIDTEVEAGRLDPQADKASFDKVVLGSFAAIPQVRLAAYISPDKQITFYDRDKRQVATMPLSESVVASERYAKLQGIVRPTWDEPFWSPNLQQTVILLGTPLARAGRKMGEFALAVTVSQLSLQLASKGEQLGLVPYVLYGEQRVLAHPSLIGWKPLGNGMIDALPALPQVNDGVLQEIWNEKLRFDSSTFLRLARSEGFGIDLDGRRFVFAQRRLDNYGPVPWIVGAYVPTSVVRDIRDRFVNVFIGTAGILVLAALIAFWIGRMASEPVRRVAAAAHQISAGEIANVKPLPPSTLREIDEAASAFNAMVSGIRERDRIRQVFGKYVPESVAARLLESDGEGVLAPTLTEATILFVDIGAFTETSESMHPAEIVEMLNAYFSVLADIIEDHHGVITQFQGDAVLATFNVPVRHPDHASEAVKAGIKIARAVAGQDFKGHRLKCRVGINTGEVVAGAVGASDRLSYTVHGDAVNLASRLEALNKEYGTRILVSETTMGLASGFPFRAVGDLPIRGRAGAVAVYALDPDACP